MSQYIVQVNIANLPNLLDEDGLQVKLLQLTFPRAQQVLALARKEADRFNHNFVGPRATSNHFVPATGTPWLPRLLSMTGSPTTRGTDDPGRVQNKMGQSDGQGNVRLRRALQRPLPDAAFADAVAS